MSVGWSVGWLVSLIVAPTSLFLRDVCVLLVILSPLLDRASSTLGMQMSVGWSVGWLVCSTNAFAYKS